MAEDEKVDVETPEGEVPEAIESDAAEVAEPEAAAPEAPEEEVDLGPPPEPPEELPPVECPKCAGGGAPAWMATFADMATLLMAFFVLILSFAEFNVPKFKQISGSLKNAFGVQRIIPIVEQPKGTTILSLNFSPSPSPSITQDMTQQTTDITKPDLEVKQREKDQDGGESEAAEEVVKALEDAIARGDIEVEVLGENVVVNFTPTEAKDEELPNLLQEQLLLHQIQSHQLPLGQT